jgi:nucleotide-binding universal stress UspA family protein
MRSGHDLVFRVNKGKESHRRGFFGNTGIRLLRKCPCAVWLVTPSRVKFQHVLGCVDTSTEDTLDAELNDAVFELAKSISHYHGGLFSIVHAWSVWNALFLQRRMDPDEFKQMVKKNHDHTEMHLDKFLKEHGSDVHDDNVHLIEGEPADAISRFAVKNDVDLVVMGTVARSGVAGMVMGNTAEQILSRMECSVLALKPSSFVSPIQMQD